MSYIDQITVGSTTYDIQDSNALQQSGSSQYVLAGQDKNLNNFYSGIALCAGDVVNNPFADWSLVISGACEGTATQVAYKMWNNSAPRLRRCASGTWSSWEIVRDIESVSYSSIDSLDSTGFYKMTGTAATVIHINWDTNYAAQIMHAYGEDKLKYRIKAGNVWYSWYTLARDSEKVNKEGFIDTGTDLNTVVESGFYRMQDNLVNAPAGADSWSQLIVCNGYSDVAAGTVAQIYISYTNADVYVRTAGGGRVWTAWRKLGDVSKTGDTMTGALCLKSSNVDGTQVPSSSAEYQYGDAELALYDKNGVRFGYFLPQNVGGTLGIQFAATRNVNGSDVYHAIQLGIDSNGDPSVYFNYPDAWLGALGLLSVESSTTISSVATAASGFSITSVVYKRWGKVAQVSITATRTGAAITSAQSVTVCTLVSGKRPGTTISIPPASTTLTYGSINSSGTCSVRVSSWDKDASKTFRAIYLLP